MRDNKPGNYTPARMRQLALLSLLLSNCHLGLLRISTKVGCEKTAINVEHILPFAHSVTTSGTQIDVTIQQCLHLFGLLRFLYWMKQGEEKMQSGFWVNGEDCSGCWKVGTDDTIEWMHKSPVSCPERNAIYIILPNTGIALVTSLEKNTLLLQDFFF